MNKDDTLFLNILELEKHMTNSYTNFLLLSSNDYLYENIFSMMEDTADMSREIYNYLYNKTYNLEEVKDSVLNRKIKELEKLIK